MATTTQRAARGGRRLVLALSSLLAAGALAAPSAPATTGPLVPQFQISNAGPANDANREVFAAGIARNSTDRDYLVTWDADALATDDEFEAFGQLLDVNGAQFGPDDLRISNAGTDGDPAREAVFPLPAYNSETNEYLVVWIADGLATDNEDEIFAQRLSAAGAEIGGDFRVSDVGNDGDAGRDAGNHAIAYNSVANEHLVVWQGDDLATNDETEIFGQRLSATGAELGTNDFRISNVGTDNDATRDAARPWVAYNPTANEYLVVWHADALATDNEDEIWGQRLSATGAEIGGDFRISTTGADGDANRDATRVFATFNVAANEYLVGWEADGLATDDDFEVFAQRLSPTGTEVGGDFRISQTGPEGEAGREAGDIDIAPDHASGEYLVSWTADGFETLGEREVFGQRLSASGAKLDPQFRISRTGTDGDAERAGQFPAAAHDPIADEWMVTWEADGLETDDEFEMFATRVAKLPAAPAPRPAAPAAEEPSFNLKKAIKRCKKKFERKKKRRKCIRKARKRARADD